MTDTKPNDLLRGMHLARVVRTDAGYIQLWVGDLVLQSEYRGDWDTYATRASEINSAAMKEAAALRSLRADLAAIIARAEAAEKDAERWFNLLRGYRKMVNDVAPHFDKPITDDNVVLWLNLNNAGRTVDAAIDAARGGK